MNLILQEDSYILLPMFMMSLPMGYIGRPAGFEAQKDVYDLQYFGARPSSVRLEGQWRAGGPPDQQKGTASVRRHLP